MDVISSITTREGLELLKRKIKGKIKANYLLGEDIIDQVCERDFYFGIAGSGIYIETKEGMKKAPYFEPFGNPVERASIPEEYKTSFSRGCIERSIALWMTIDELRGEQTKIKELPEKIIGTEEEEEVVKVLRKKGRSL